PISPLGMTTIQAHHAWGYHSAARTTSLPPSKGGHVKIYRGRVYIGFALIEDPEEIASREPEFKEFLDYCIENWDEYYGELIGEVKANLNSQNGVNTDTLILPQLLEYLREANRLDRRNWEIHFLTMYPADAIYFIFEDYCKEKGLEESKMLTMLRGVDNIALRTDGELWDLAKLTEELGFKDVILKTEAGEILEKLKGMPEARDWLDKFDQFLSIYGNRVVAAHMDVLTPTWVEDPTPVLDTLKGYYTRMEKGYDFHKEKQDILDQRDKAIRDHEAQLKDEEELKEFQRMIKAAHGIYYFQEDHGFYIDQGSTAMVRKAGIACGKRLLERGLIKELDDVCYLTYHELEEVIEAIAYDDEAARYHYGALIPNVIAERKADAKKVPDLDAPLTLGNVPEKMTDPVGVKVFGIIDEILHPKDEKVVAERIEGFPGAPGVVEGPAKRIMDYKEFQRVETGDILVCPYTGTAWTPLFVKIAGIVTDTGGMLTHAAIAAREYNIPAVVGTWKATHSINDGDIIRIDGTAGVVEILKRAK
ncbi:MAG: PEP-utilizing enzyme, partial [Pseudomonadota bacterium]